MMRMRKNQGGWIEFALLGVLAVVLISVGYGALHVYNKAIEDKIASESRAKVAQKAADDQAKVNADLRVSNALLDQQTAARKGSDVKKADIERMITNALQRTYEKSPEARQWAATPVPSDVLISVRNEAAGSSGSGKDGARPVTPPVGKPDPGGAVAAPNDQRGITRLRTPFDKPVK